MTNLCPTGVDYVPVIGKAEPKAYCVIFVGRTARIVNGRLEVNVPTTEVKL
jgi:hypothetical protein